MVWNYHFKNMTGNALEIIKWLYSHKDKEEQLFDIVEHKEKRGLRANAYCWTMLGKIADCVGNTKIEVYREYVKKQRCI